MKIFIISFLSIVFFSSVSLSDEVIDCSKYSKLSSKFYSCKTANLVKETKDYQKKKWSKEKKKVNKIKKKILD